MLLAYVAQNKTIPALMQLAIIQEQKRQFAAAGIRTWKVLAVNANFALALNNLAVLSADEPGQL